MNYGGIKIKVRGKKYKVEYEGYYTYATNENGERQLLDSHLLKDPERLKDRIKFAWKLKPYRRVDK